VPPVEAALSVMREWKAAFSVLKPSWTGLKMTASTRPSIPRDVAIPFEKYRDMEDSRGKVDREQALSRVSFASGGRAP
jgi:hypothetical protein